MYRGSSHEPKLGTAQAVVAERSVHKSMSLQRRYRLRAYARGRDRLACLCTRAGRCGDAGFAVKPYLRGAVERSEVRMLT